MFNFRNTAVLFLLLVGCSSIDMNQYQSNTPAFNLYDYFQGDVKGWGIVQNWKGALTRQFTVSINGELNEENELVLDENFNWSDGEQSKRVWQILENGRSKYIGKADDVHGSAAGMSSGNVLNWQYTLNLKVDENTWKIAFDDWMFLQQDGILINKAVMRKFGFKVGEVTIVFMKQ